MNMPIETKLPENLIAKAQQLVNAGWASDFDELLTDALRRYVESHSEELENKFIREDIEWGLHGHG